MKKFVLSILLSALMVFTGCKGGLNELQANAKEGSDAPASAPAPVAIEGSRVSYADIVDKSSPAVVRVAVEIKGKKSGQPMMEDEGGMPFPFPMPQMPQAPQRRQPQRGVGSGVIVSEDGTIITNNHVVEGADKITIQMDDEKKQSFEAKVVGLDKPTDLAVLKIEAKGLPFLNLGDSDKVRVGDVVLAIGNPLGIGQTVTQGIISAKGRRTGLGDVQSFEDFLQTDAPINRGNSGGALINLNGELIGINSQILSSGMSGGSIGIGFAIPANMAKSVMEQLLKDGKVQRGMLGINIQNVDKDLAESLGLEDTKGALISNVKKASAAEKAGLKRDDVVISVNGEKVDDSNTLRNKVAATKPGGEIKLTIIREGKQQEITATLDELTENAMNNPGTGNDGKPGEGGSNGKLGLDLQPLTPDLLKRLQLPADSKGVVVVDVDPDGAAAEKGIEKGDLIQSINGKEVESLDDVSKALEGSGGKAIRLLISRGGNPIYLTVKPKVE